MEFIGVPALIFLSIWGYHVLKGIASGETTGGWGPFWADGDPRKRVHWDWRAKTCRKFDSELGQYVDYEPSHGELCKLGQDWGYWDSGYRIFQGSPPAPLPAAKKHREDESESYGAPAIDEFGTPKQRIYWNGQQWMIWDSKSREWVPQAAEPIPSAIADPPEPKQRIRWDGVRWMIWDQRSRRWIPQVDR